MQGTCQGETLLLGEFKSFTRFYILKKNSQEPEAKKALCRADTLLGMKHGLVSCHTFSLKSITELRKLIVNQFNWFFSGAPGQCLGSGGRHKACQVPGEISKKMIQYLLIVSCFHISNCRLRKSCCCWRSTSAHRTWLRPVDASWTLRFTSLFSITKYTEG